MRIDVMYPVVLDINRELGVGVHAVEATAVTQALLTRATTVMDMVPADVCHLSCRTLAWVLIHQAEFASCESSRVLRHNNRQAPFLHRRNAGRVVSFRHALNVLAPPQ